MDPVSTAIVSTIKTGFIKLGEKAITEGYEKLKDLLKKKFGKNSEVVESVKKLEARPDSEGRQKTLEEEVKAAGADQDGDILEAAGALLQIIEKRAGNSGGIAIGEGAKAVGERGVQTGGAVTGSVIVTGDKNSVIQKRGRDDG